MLPRGITRIAIIPVNTVLHAQNIAMYSPYCEVANGYSPADLAVFVGFSPGSRQFVNMFKAKGIPTLCWWIGSDVEMFKMTEPKPPEAFDYDIHWSTCQAQHDKLKAGGIESYIQPVVPAYTYPILKVDVKYEGMQKYFQPLKKKVLFYVPVGRTDMPLTWDQVRAANVGDTYCISEMFDIVEACPEIQFTIVGNNSPIEGGPPNAFFAGKVEQYHMHNVYAEQDFLIRKTTHGELAQSIIEAKQSGCQVICNHELPFTHLAKTKEEFISKLKAIEPTVDFEGSIHYQKEYNPQKVLDGWAQYIRLETKQAVAAEFNGEMKQYRSVS